MRTIIQKVDLDTCLAALMLGVDRETEVVVAQGGASAEELRRPDVLCIEAGGSGEVHLNNFDHHDPARYLPPACRQVLDLRGITDDGLVRLTRYVSMVDEAIPIPEPIPFPSLSGLFSGMRLVETEVLAQLYRGLDILARVHSEGWDPFASMPALPEWADYLAAKAESRAAAQVAFQDPRTFRTVGGRRAGFVESEWFGGFARLFKQGVDIGVLYHPRFGVPPIPKFTIASSHVPVIGLLPQLDRLEPGWGGRETIIGSPRTGTALSVETVLEIVREHL